MDDPRVLALVEQYIRRHGAIQSLTNMLDDPGRVAAAVRIEEVIGESVKRRLDDVCENITKIINVPMAAVTLVDDSTHVVLGVCGVLKDAQRDRAYCIFVAAAGLDFSLDDLTLDEREVLPVYNDTAIRAYLGVPLKIDGDTIGALCILDYVQREWTDLERELLHNFAAHVSVILEKETQ